mgnify:CR=1 FL=1
MSKAASVREGDRDTAAFLRAWDAAEDGLLDCAQGRILQALTRALENEGLTEGGALTKKAKALIRRVDAAGERKAAT